MCERCLAGARRAIEQGAAARLKPNRLKLSRQIQFAQPSEQHGPHMPIDTDTHQAEYIAVKLAERIGALVAPPVAYGVSMTFEHFPGTISLTS